MKRLLVDNNEYYSLEDVVASGAGDFGQFEMDRNRLVFTRVLGQGNFGAVALASLLPSEGESHADGVSNVAVKTLKASTSLDEQALFLLEARIMTKLIHPNLLELIGVCTVGLPLLLITEFMNGGDLVVLFQDFLVIFADRHLQTYLRNCRPECTPPLAHIGSQALYSMALQIASALKFLHSHNIIHRDLAARNVLVQDVGVHHVKLADFGMSRTLDGGEYQ